MDEIVLSRASTNEACEEFRDAVPGIMRRGCRFTAMRAAHGMQTAGTTDYEIINEFLRRNAYQHVMRVPRSNPAVRDRIAMVNATFENGEGQARLFVHPQCKELIMDFEQVGFQADSTMIDKDERSASGRIYRMRWGTWFGRSAGEPVGERSERLL